MISAVVVLFIFTANGQPEPLLAQRDTETCWAHVAVLEASGMQAECRIAQIAPMAAAPSLAPTHSPRPKPRPDHVTKEKADE
jgi:hypothetical protein